MCRAEKSSNTRAEGRLTDNAINHGIPATEKAIDEPEDVANLYSGIQGCNNKAEWGLKADAKSDAAIGSEEFVCKYINMAYSVASRCSDEAWDATDAIRDGSIDAARLMCWFQVMVLVHQERT